MRRKKVSELLQRFLTGRKEGRTVYFDADEIDELLDSFEDSDDFTYYDEVLALGLKLHPYNTDIKIRQCRAYIYNEQYDEALSLIESIADTDNQDLDMLRLECYAMMNEYKKVVEYTETLINHQCEYIEQLFEYIAQVLGDLEMNQEAHDFVNRGLMLFPDNLILLDELCFHLELEEDIPKAIKICNLLIDKNPYSHDYWFTLGRLHSIQGEYDKAIEAFDFALTCNDSDDELKILKAYCLYMNSNYEKAIANYISMVDPESVQLAGIPVEISADGNTVTLKSYTVKGSNNEDVDLYPNVLYENNGGLYFYNPYIVSEVVLTKGWTEPAEPAAPAKLSTRNLGKVNGGKRVANDAEYKTPAKTASRTVFAPGTKKVEAKTITRKFNTPEETHKGMEALLKRRQPAIRK